MVMNVRLRKRREGEEEIMGEHHLEEADENRETPADQEQNKEKLVELCNLANMRIRNTDFQKPNSKKCTFRKCGKEPGPPYSSDKYAELDHILTKNKTKNMITDIEANIKANLNTDHYPVICTFRQKLGRPTNTTQRSKYSIEGEERINKYNEMIEKEATGKEVTLENITETIIKAVKATWTKGKPKQSEDWIKQETRDILERRKEAKEANNEEEFQKLTLLATVCTSVATATISYLPFVDVDTTLHVTPSPLTSGCRAVPGDRPYHRPRRVPR